MTITNLQDWLNTNHMSTAFQLHKLCDEFDLNWHQVNSEEELPNAVIEFSSKTATEKLRPLGQFLKGKRFKLPEWSLVHVERKNVQRTQLPPEPTFDWSKSTGCSG